MRWVIRGYAFILLGYTAWRTVDFLLSQLPTGDVSLWLSIAFLFASECGLLIWHEVSLNYSTTREQHGLSVVLTWTDFVASLAAGTADMILRQTLLADYRIPNFLAEALIYGLPLVMAANVAGVLIYLSNDAETQLDRAKKTLRFEVTRQAIRELEDNMSAIAEGMKKDIARKLRDDVTGKLAKQYLQDPKPAQIAQEKRRPIITMLQSSKNGHKVNYNAEAEIEELETDRPNVDLGKVKK